MPNPSLENAYLACPECAYTPAVDDPLNYLGCPHCKERLGYPVNFECRYRTKASPRDFQVARQSGPSSRGIWRWRAMLPDWNGEPITMGEGDTPVVPLERVADQIGLESLHLKNEGANPTWSHKDRLCASAVTAACGLNASAVVGASTGNHGAALAAYAARAGLPCHVATVDSVPRTMRALMLSYGAHLVMVENSDDRYEVIEDGVRDQGWFPCSNGSVPPVGSTPFGVDAYKTIAFELWESFEDDLDCVVVPSGYGDCLLGIVRGFCDLLDAGLIAKLPKIIAAEVFGKLTHAMSGTRSIGPRPVAPTAAFSIGGPYTTHQAARALELAQGTAIDVPEVCIMATQHELAAQEGLYVEASAAVSVAAARLAREAGILHPTDKTVVISTSTGLKDPEGTLEWLDNSHGCRSKNSS